MKSWVYKMKLSIAKYGLILLVSIFLTGAVTHPVYVSVTEIEHNPKTASLEIVCRIFTGDLETRLRAETGAKVDLLAPKDKKQMEALVSGYLHRHLSFKAEGKSVQATFLGYQQKEDAIESFLEIENIPLLHKLEVKDNILFEYQQQQMNIIHVTVNGVRKSTRLNNPDEDFTAEF